MCIRDSPHSRARVRPPVPRETDRRRFTTGSRARRARPTRAPAPAALASAPRRSRSSNAHAHRRRARGGRAARAETRARWVERRRGRRPGRRWWSLRGRAGACSGATSNSARVRHARARERAARRRGADARIRGGCPRGSRRGVREAFAGANRGIGPGDRGRSTPRRSIDAFAVCRPTRE